jgi:hypothetical protein
MNFFWQQTIVGLLRHAGQEIPNLEERSKRLAEAVDHEPAPNQLAEAFTLFQEAARLSHNPVYMTGAFYAMQAIQQGAVAPQENHQMNPTTSKDGVTEEVERGLLELFDRIRQGATLDEALALFPLIGDEMSPTL